MTRTVLPLTRPAATQALEDPREHGTVRFDIDQTPRAGNRRMVGRHFVQVETQRVTQR
jgi:hypothetical protein